MSQLVTVTGMILSVAPIGENDKRLVILTKEKGKISAFAKGARRQNSPLLGVTNPFVFGEFSLYEGRTSYNLMQANVINYFMELASDLEGAYYGFYFMEFADYYTREYNDERQMLKLLYQTLRALSSSKIPRKLVRCVFELKALAVNGEQPEVFRCIHCGSKEQLIGFSVRGRGTICNECKIAQRDLLPLLPATVYTLQYIIASTVEKLYTFTVSDEVLAQLTDVVQKYTEEYVEKRFKSLEILQMCLRTE